ncbi:MAG: hypothetical protein MUC41_15075 [Syntrophobacteraceae bacterium]|jgi:hypothetical protein|nr:hypothetical protein [Syntrophobacteraceae bacterium]
MDLTVSIRGDRARQRKKPPRDNQVFNVLGCIVKDYGLKRDFLGRVDGIGDRAGRGAAEVLRIWPKSRLEVPPYVLVSGDEYRLVSEIMERLDNPYLAFARSPEEVLLSATLHARNPTLEDGLLLRRDFETLLLCEEAREELSRLERLERRAGGASEEPAGGDGVKTDEEGGVTSALRQERIQRLRAFLAKVEHMEPQAL